MHIHIYIYVYIRAFDCSGARTCCSRCSTSHTEVNSLSYMTRMTTSVVHCNEHPAYKTTYPQHCLFRQVESDPDDRDAETRVAAVKALAAVAQKLFNPASSSADSPSAHGLQADSTAADSASHESASNGLVAASEPADSGVIGNCGESAGGGVAADPAAAALVREPLMGALLAAVEDYSTDNRWVGTHTIGNKETPARKETKQKCSLKAIL